MPDLSRPLIALNGVLDTSGGEPALRLHERYARAVLRAGGLPVAVPAVGEPRDLELLLERVDGLVLCGGDDFDTGRLGLGPTHSAAQVTPAAKQDFDLALTRAALDARLPVLGICYGMQCLGLVGGAGLLQHLPEDRPDGQEHRHGAEHPVRVDPDSKLGEVLGVASLPVISRHHQALTSVPAPWRVCATDEQDLVEAIEQPELPFAVGVQWHPELSPQGSPHDRLFRALVHAASTARTDLTFARSRP
jgi:putative glutamine amidotransferase